MNMKEKIQDDKILLRLPSTLTGAVDQILKEQLPGLNRSEFIRRAVRYTLDNIEQFKTSEAAVQSEKLAPENVEKINAVREQYEQLLTYTEKMQKEPNNALYVKQLAFLIKLIGTMVFKMQDPA
jgi:metal-responsive CopG/Arc/MetJ family transcriptional regulator